MRSQNPLPQQMMCTKPTDKQNTYPHRGEWVDIHDMMSDKRVCQD
jgi:hypothetical protein